MPLFLNTAGNRYLAIGYCSRCQRKFPLGELVKDPDTGLRVCVEDRDEPDPWRKAWRGPDSTVLPFIAPDLGWLTGSNINQGLPIAPGNGTGNDGDPGGGVVTPPDETVANLIFALNASVTTVDEPTDTVNGLLFAVTAQSALDEGIYVPPPPSDLPEISGSYLITESNEYLVDGAGSYLTT